MYLLWFWAFSGVVLFICALFRNLTLPSALLVLLAAYFLGNALYLLFFQITGLFVDRTKPIQKVKTIYRLGCRSLPVFLCAHCRVRVSIEGKERIPEDSRFVIVSNHRSGFDPITLAAALKSYDISFISKPSNFNIPVVGGVAYGGGYLPIDRENDRNALRTILTAADYLKKDFCSVGIYPEGTRSQTEEMLPFHAGSFKIAQKAGVPLVIAATTGTEKIKENVPWKSTYVKISVVDVLSADTVKQMSTSDLADYSKNRIYQALLEMEKQR